MADAVRPEGLIPGTLAGMPKIILRREGRDDATREIDEVNRAEAQYIVLSEHAREVFHFDGCTYDDAGAAVYEYQSTDERQWPKITGGS